MSLASSTTRAPAPQYSARALRLRAEVLSRKRDVRDRRLFFFASLLRTNAFSGAWSVSLGGPMIIPPNRPVTELLKSPSRLEANRSSSGHDDKISVCQRALFLLANGGNRANRRDSSSSERHVEITRQRIQNLGAWTATPSTLLFGNLQIPIAARLDG